ncbi:MAG: alpha/beta fold hydrolase [Actinomycetota bacterium]
MTADTASSPPPLHPVTEPKAEGFLDVGDGHRVHWSESGDPHGKPAVLLHGGPGSGAVDRHRRLFDPERYRIVQFDQRQCGLSTPSAAEPAVDLSTNTITHLLADIEALRTHLGIDRWLVWGGSWGTTLGLAYAVAHPEAVTELVLASVVTTSAADVEWTTRTMGRLFPEEWAAFVGALPPEGRHGNLALAFNRLLLDPDPAIHQPAADAWCRWEDVHVSIGAGGVVPGLQAADPAYRLCFARLVTHYWGHAGFLPDGHLAPEAVALALDGIPVFLTHGRLDVSAPVDVPVALAEAIGGAELHIAEGDGHGGASMASWTMGVTDRLVR